MSERRFKRVVIGRLHTDEYKVTAIRRLQDSLNDLGADVADIKNVKSTPVKTTVIRTTEPAPEPGPTIIINQPPIVQPPIVIPPSIGVLAASFGDGKNTDSIAAGLYDDTPRLPFGVNFNRWEILSYDSSGNKLAINCTIDVQAATYPVDVFQTITNGVLPSLVAIEKAEGLDLTAWQASKPFDTMFRVILVAFTGLPAKIVFGARGVKLQ